MSGQTDDNICTCSVALYADEQHVVWGRTYSFGLKRSAKSSESLEVLCQSLAILFDLSPIESAENGASFLLYGECIIQ